MGSKVESALREDERQEKLLADAIRAADLLDAVRRRSLYRHVLKRVEADVAGAPKSKRSQTAPKPTTDTASSNGSKTNGAGTYTDQGEEFVLASKKGVTTRQFADHSGQSYGSADGTLRYVAENRGTIIRRDDKWFPVPGAKRRPTKNQAVTIGAAVTMVFEKNGNSPLAAKDIFKGVKATLPDAKKGSVDAQLVGLRKDGTLVQKGTAPHGGGLYHLANYGGAQAANAN